MLGMIVKTSSVSLAVEGLVCSLDPSTDSNLVEADRFGVGSLSFFRPLCLGDGLGF